MKATNLENLPLAEAVRSSDDGQNTDFTYLPSRTPPQDGSWLNRLLLTAVIVMAAMFAWTCWNLVKAPQAFSTKPLLATVGALSVCLLGLAAGAGAVLWNLHVASKSARQAQKRELLLSTLIDTVPDYVYAKDTEGRFIIANVAVARQLGFSSPKEIIGKSDLDLFPSELAERDRVEEQKIIHSGRGIYSYEGPTVDESQPEKHRWVATTKVPIKNARGETTGFIGLGRDITERKRAEAALQESQALYHSLVADLPIGIFRKDRAGRFVLANPGFCRLKGMNAEEFLGKTPVEVSAAVAAKRDTPELVTKYAGQSEDHHRLIMRTGNSIELDEEYSLADGRKLFVHATKFPVLDRNGTIVGTQGILVDITERKLAEEALVHERTLLRTLIDSLPDCIYAKDVHGRKTMANLADLKNMHCKAEADVLGKTDFEVFPKEIAEKFWADDQAVLHGRPVLNREEHFFDEAGSNSWLLTSKLPLRDAGGNITGLVGIGRDITERKLAEAAQRRSEEQMREVLRRTRCILNFGEAAAPEDWRERVMNEPTIFRWNFPVANPEAAQAVLELDVPPGGQYQEAWIASRNPDDFDRMHQVARDAFLNNAPFYRNEFRCTDKHGVEHWMQEFITIHQLTENHWQLFGINTDITDLKKSETALRSSEGKLRSFTAQLERSNRELQDFAYVASHDLQEPLRKIVVFGDRLKEKCSDSLVDESRDYLDRMQKAALRMQTLINDLLTFSRVTSKARPFASVNLTTVAHEVVSDLEARIEQVQGRVEIGTLPVIDAEALQMRQVLQNLIGNALKFRRPETPPLVTVAARKFTDDLGREFCELTVRDNGIGFEEKYLDRIFNVFQRLHSRAEFEGNGMGLAIVKKIALYHGGDITAQSQPGTGTTFILTLPTTHPKTNETDNPGKHHEN